MWKYRVDRYDVDVTKIAEVDLLIFASDSCSFVYNTILVYVYYFDSFFLNFYSPYMGADICKRQGQLCNIGSGGRSLQTGLIGDKIWPDC